MLAEFKVGDEVLSFFMAQGPPETRENKWGKPYLCLALQDSSGEVDGRVWDVPKDLDPKSIKQGSIVKVKGTMGEYQGKMQLSIVQVRLALESETPEIGDFLPRSERDPEEMLADLEKILDELQDSDRWNSTLSALLVRIIQKNKDKLLLAPAAKSVHHAYIGGLLEHTLSMARLAVLVADHYRLNKHLLLAGVVLHDIGKLYELSYPVGFGFTVEGTLLGHISLGMDLVSKEFFLMEQEGLVVDPKLKAAVLHLIASHHGLMAYGSPRVPLMREAVALNMIDGVDAKLAICDSAIKKGIDGAGLTSWVKELEGPLYAYDNI